MEPAGIATPLTVAASTKAFWLACPAWQVAQGKAG
jgi:hypothetical protein